MSEDPGVGENARLTSATGIALLLPLLAVTGSGLVFDALWRVHYFAGFLLIPLIGVKLASTGYRAARYYGGDPGFRRAGPPHPLLRGLAPVLVVSTLLLLLSGVVMWAARSRLQPWSMIHTDAAVAFVAVAAVHLLARLPRAARAAGAGAGASRAGAGRRATLVGAAVVGLVLAVATIPWSQLPRHAPHRQDRAAQAGPPPAAALP